VVVPDVDERERRGFERTADLIDRPKLEGRFPREFGAIPFDEERPPEGERFGCELRDFQPVKVQVSYSIRKPEIALEITSCWICSVPSKMSMIFQRTKIDA
jgi:hypothetical protein